MFNALSSTYLIELDRWGINGDPTNNSNGINNAIAWAANEGYSQVVFPQKEYIIKEDIPVRIKNFRDIKFDLNGASLKINPNGLTSNKILHIADCKNIQLMNGSVVGDVATHDYKKNPGTHEGNLGILLDSGVVNITLDNLIIKGITGWGITTSIGKDYIGYPPVGIVKSNLRTGTIDCSNGDQIDDSTRISTIVPIDITRLTSFEDKYFILAYDKGYMGNPYLTTKRFDVIFYDKAKTIIAVIANQLIYKKVAIPDNAVYVDFIFYQSELPTRADTDFNGAVLFITHYVQPTDSKITNCIIDGCRSLGMAICGGDNITIENCIIKNTKGQAPGYGVDLEDGWEFMNNIKFINNKFENNANDFVSCAGDNLVIEGNTFTKTFYIWSRTTNYIIKNNTFIGSSATFRTDINRNDFTVIGNEFVNTTARNADFTNCSFENSSITGGNAYDCTFRSNTGVNLNGNFRDCKFNNFAGQGDFNLFNCELSDSSLQLLRNGQIAKKNTVDNCIFEKSSLSPFQNIDLNVTNSRFNDSTILVGGAWNKDLYISLEYNIIVNPNIKAPFINALNSFGSINLKNNVLSITSTQPIIKLANPTGIADVNIRGNKCSTTDGVLGNVVIVTFGTPGSLIVLRDVNNIFSNLIISEVVKNKNIINYTVTL